MLVGRVVTLVTQALRVMQEMLAVVEAAAAVEVVQAALAALYAVLLVVAARPDLCLGLLTETVGQVGPEGLDLTQPVVVQVALVMQDRLAQGATLEELGPVLQAEAQVARAEQALMVTQVTPVRQVRVLIQVAAEAQVPAVRLVT